MDAIRKKMKSLKSETDQLNKIISGFEEETRDAVARAEQAEVDIRDYGKKCSKLEFDFDETNEQLVKVNTGLYLVIKVFGQELKKTHCLSVCDRGEKLF